MLLLTGPVGVGKTTVAERAIGLARRQGRVCTGLLAPAMLDACGQKAGIWGIDLMTGERRVLARTDRSLGGPHLGPYSFDAAVLEWATAVVLKALASSLPTGSLSSPPARGGLTTLVIVDEIGKLELWHEQGLAPVLPVLAAGQARSVLVIVRDTLLEELQRRLAPVMPAVYRVSEQNLETAPAEVVEALR
jgi:nucleoside-triphosphatase THEP1